MEKGILYPIKALLLDLLKSLDTPFDKMDKDHLINNPELWRRSISNCIRGAIIYFIVTTFLMFLYCKTINKNYINIPFLYLLSIILTFNIIFFIFFMKNLERPVKYTKYFFFNLDKEQAVLNNIVKVYLIFICNSIILTAIPYFFFSPKPKNLENLYEFEVMITIESMTASTDSVSTDSLKYDYIKNSILNHLLPEKYPLKDSIYINSLINKFDTVNIQPIIYSYYTLMDIKFDHYSTSSLTIDSLTNKKKPTSDTVTYLNQINTNIYYQLFFTFFLLIGIIALICCGLLYVYFGSIPNNFFEALPLFDKIEKKAKEILFNLISIIILFPLLTAVIDIGIYYFLTPKSSTNTPDFIVTSMLFDIILSFLIISTYLIFIFIIFLFILMPYIFFKILFKKMPEWKFENLQKAFSPVD